MRKQLTILIVLTLLILPLEVMAQDVAAREMSWWENTKIFVAENLKFLALGYTNRGTGCSDATGGHKDIFEIGIDYYNDLPEQLYMYNEVLSEDSRAEFYGKVERYNAVTVTKQRDGRQDAKVTGSFGGWGGRYLLAKGPQTVEQISACIPGYKDPNAPVTEIPGAVKACSGTSNLQITKRVTIPSGTYKVGQALPITVHLENLGGQDVSSHNVECGVYDTNSAYIKGRNGLLSFVRQSGNCNPTENNVRTVEVVNLQPGETYDATVIPYIPASVTGTYEIICGIYPTGQCGEYTNQCEDDHKGDFRVKK